MTPQQLIQFGRTTVWGPSKQDIIAFLTYFPHGPSILGNPFDLFSHENISVSCLYGRIVLEALALGFVSPHQLGQAFGSTAQSSGLLTKLINIRMPRYAFLNALRFLREAYAQGWMSQGMYFHLLFSPLAPEYTVLHQFALSTEEEDVANLEVYLSVLSELPWTADWNQRICFDLLAQKNTCGFSVMHQMANAKNIRVGLTFWRWFEKNDMCLSLGERRQLLYLRTYASGIPKRHFHPCYPINHVLDKLRANLRVELTMILHPLSVPFEELQMMNSSRTTSRFFPEKTSCDAPEVSFSPPKFY